MTNDELFIFEIKLKQVKQSLDEIISFIENDINYSFPANYYKENPVFNSKSTYPILISLRNIINTIFEDELGIKADGLGVKDLDETAFYNKLKDGFSKTPDTLISDKNSTPLEMFIVRKYLEEQLTKK